MGPGCGDRVCGSDDTGEVARFAVIVVKGGRVAQEGSCVGALKTAKGTSGFRIGSARGPQKIAHAIIVRRLRWVEIDDAEYRRTECHGSVHNSLLTEFTAKKQPPTVVPAAIGPPVSTLSGLGKVTVCCSAKMSCSWLGDDGSQ